MFYFWPIFGKIETGAVVLDVAKLAGLTGVLPESRLRVRCMVQARTVAHLALHILQLRCVHLADESARLVEIGRAHV